MEQMKIVLGKLHTDKPLEVWMERYEDLTDDECMIYQQAYKILDGLEVYFCLRYSGEYNEWNMVGWEKYDDEKIMKASYLFEKSLGEIIYDKEKFYENWRNREHVTYTMPWFYSEDVEEIEDVILDENGEFKMPDQKEGE